MNDFRKITIESNQYGTQSVYGYGVYSESSILAGQPRKTFLAEYNTVVEAQAEYPTATVDDGYTPDNTMTEHAPDWFNPANAGEEW